MKKIVMTAVMLSVLLLVTSVVLSIYSDKPLPEGTTITRIVIYKSNRQMLVFEHQKLLKSYTIALGRNPVGKKEIEGDGKTPEGVYIVEDKNPNSDYHLNLGVSYPNEEDKARAAKLGKNPGGDIKIHGLKNGWGFIGKLHHFLDWTEGCIAVTNAEIEEIFAATSPRTPIEIYP